MIAPLDAKIVIGCLNASTASSNRTCVIQVGLHHPDNLDRGQLKAPTGREQARREAIDANFKSREINEAILVKSLNLRRSHCLKLPNAMIWASVQILGWKLVTRNTKDFAPEWVGIRLPYML